MLSSIFSLGSAVVKSSDPKTVITQLRDVVNRYRDNKKVEA